LTIRKSGTRSMCIYCGRETADTRDHVPPKCLIRPKHRANLWTVPSCAQCNASYSRDEEYFRLMVVGALCHTPEADELFDGPISRSMNRRPSIEGQLFNSLGVEGVHPFVQIDHDRISRVAMKIAVGLSYCLGVDPPSLTAVASMSECEGRGTQGAWAPDFTFDVCRGCLALWLYDSVLLTVASLD